MSSTEHPTSEASEPLIRLEADITEDGRFGVRHLHVDRQNVSVSDSSGTRLLTVPLNEIKHATTEALVSGGRLVVTTVDGETVPVISYSSGYADPFGDAALAIRTLVAGEEPAGPITPAKKRCEKCGRLLPDSNGPCPQCVNRGKTLLRIAAFIGPYKKQTVLLAVCASLATLVNLGPPAIQGMILDQFNKGQRSLDWLWQWVALWAGLLLMAAIFQVINGRLMAFLGSHIASDLRQKTYRSIEFLKLDFFDKKPVGAIASRVTQDTDRVWFFLVDGLPFFVVHGLMLVAVLTMLFRINVMLALAILAPIPLVVLISVKIWKPISSMFHRASQKMARVHMHLNESLTGIRVVKAFAKEDHEYARFQRRSEELRAAMARADMSWHTAFGLMTFCVSLGTVIHWSFGGWMLFTGRLTLGQFYMVHAYLAMVYGPLQWFAQVNNWFSRAMAGAERIFEIMDMSSEPVMAGGSTAKIQGAIEYRNVIFGYDKANPVIKDVSFSVKPGEMIGLVGHSGAGKSTTINLVCRFYEPDAGQILVDGKDYREYDLRAFREQIGIVLQEPFLFHGTIAENISYGKPSASMEEIIAAAQAANAHDFILSKPEGYDTVVGERGAKLSGGEKQRVSIARAILHNPQILILDEATSSVDVETERQIQEAIQRLISGRTTFAIAHRLSTLRRADRLIVLKDGKIAETGDHAELMEKKGIFYDMVQTQSAVNEMVGIGAS